jgi:hypothetical protein
VRRIVICVQVPAGAVVAQWCFGEGFVGVQGAAVAGGGGGTARAEE